MEFTDFLFHPGHSKSERVSADTMFIHLLILVPFLKMEGRSSWVFWLQTGLISSSKNLEWVIKLGVKTGNGDKTGNGERKKKINYTS